MFWLQSLVVSALPLGICLVLSAALGRGQLLKRWTFVWLVLLGALGGVFFALFGAETVDTWSRWLLGPSRTASLYGQAFAEELGKALILLVLLRTRDYRSPVDGLLFGLAAGTGFAAVENIGYGAVAYGWGGGPEFWGTMIGRVPASLVIHGGTTALVGAGLAEIRWEKRRWAVLLAFPALLCVATFIHGGWNSLVTQAVTSDPAAIGAAGLLFAMIFLGIVLLVYASDAEDRAILTELEAEVDSGKLTATSVMRATKKPNASRFRWMFSRTNREKRKHALRLAYARRRNREHPNRSPHNEDKQEQLDALRSELRRRDEP